MNSVDSNKHELRRQSGLKSFSNNRLLPKNTKNLNEFSLPSEEDEKLTKSIIMGSKKRENTLSKVSTVDMISNLGSGGSGDALKLPILVLPRDVMTHTSPNQTFIPFTKLLLTYRGKIKELQDDEIVSYAEAADGVRELPSMTLDVEGKKRSWKKKLMFNKKQENEYHMIIEKENERLYNEVLKSIDKKLSLEKNMPKVKVYPSRKLELSPTKMFEDPTEDEKEKNQKNSNKIKYNNIIQQSIKLFWYSPNENIVWHPEVREGASFTPTDRYGYLYGGSSTHLLEDIEIIDTLNLNWQRVKPAGEAPREGRMGHTSTLYKGNLIIFGGEKRYNAAIRSRECLNDVKMFIIDSKEWRNIKCFDTIEPRRNHIAVLIGKHLIVHGGIDSQGNYLSGLVALNLGNMKWNSIVEKGNDGIGIAFHAACLVIGNERKDVGLYKTTYDPKHNDNNTSPYKHEGIYFFGGKNANDEILNTLKILKIGQKPVEWIIPEVNGQRPPPRYQHTMSYCKQLGVLVVYGGRNDKMSEGVFRDIFILELSSFTWASVQYVGNEGISRYSHVSGVFGHKMLVFGGLNQCTLVDAQVHILELDPETVKKVEKERNIYGNHRSNPMINKITQDDLNCEELTPIKKKYQEQFDFLKKFENIVTFAPKPNKVELQKGGAAILGFIQRKQNKQNTQNPIQGKKTKVVTIHSDKERATENANEKSVDKSIAHSVDKSIAQSEESRYT